MKTQHFYKILFTAFISLLFSGLSMAGTLGLSQQALELRVGSDPNVFILMDDSGSMSFETITQDASEEFTLTDLQPDGSSSGSGASFIKMFDKSAGYLGSSSTDYCSQTVSSAEGFHYGWHFDDAYFPYNSGYLCYVSYFDNWRFRSSEFNKIYYDPTQTYTPWPGLDNDGNLFANITLSAMPSDPYDSSPQTVSIDTNYRHWELVDSKWRANEETPSSTYPQGFVYYNWSDNNNDGLFDDNEETRVSLGSASAEERQNFANWFGFYRSRELLAKGAIARSIEPLTGINLAYASINGGTTGLKMTEMNESPTSGNKKDFLDYLYAPLTGGGTKLRTAYDKVGKYFECESDNIFNSTSDCPIGNTTADSCRQNYAIVITDGFYNDSSFSGIGNTDSNTSNIYDGGAFADANSNTMADIAMHYYKRDLSSLQDNVPVTALDIARSSLTENDTMHQHLNTFFIGLGVEGTLNSEPSDYTSAFTWPNPTSQDLYKIDDLRHAAYNGRGIYLSAKNSDALEEAMSTIFESIADNSASSSSVALNTQSLEQGSKIFRAFYNPNENTGDLIALEISVNGDISTTAEWSAASQLDTVIAGGNRNIISYKRDGTTIGGINFDTSSMSSAQLSALESPTPSNMPSGYGGIIADERVDYLRGSTTNEGSNFNDGEFRDRLENSGRLGDIVHSSPVFVGTPHGSNRDASPYPIATADLYSTFVAKSAVKDRTQMIYIGANDGMMHGFKAETGSEMFAYIPGQVYDNLAELTSPNYTHNAFVDLTPTVEDAYIKTSAAATSQDWATVLVGGYRAGGIGYFALDITNPNNLDTAAEAVDQVMWEFTEADDSDLGYSYSEAFIGMTNADSGTTSSADSGEVDGGGVPILTTSNNKQWGAIFGNGYNSSSTDGDAVLFILKLDGGLDDDWTNDYVKINTGYGKAESEDGTTPNGLSGIRAIDTNGNGTVDYVYAGDYQGNLFRFDLTDTDINNWKSTLIFSAKVGGTTTSEDITTTSTTWQCNSQGKGCKWVTETTTTTVYTTTGGTDYPITVRPFVVQHPEIDNEFIVVAATGSWITTGDVSTTTVESIYGIHDDLSSNPLVVKSDLVEQEFTLQTNTINDYKIRELSNNSINWNNSHGWFIDLDDAVSGERALQLQVRGGIGFATTITPKSATSCGADMESYILAFDPATGGVLSEVVFDLNGDGLFDDSDNNGSDIVAGIGLGQASSPTKIIGNMMIIPLSDGSLDTMGVQVGSSNLDGRMSWRELDVPESAY